MKLGKYNISAMERAFECGRNFQLTGESNFTELIEELTLATPVNEGQQQPVQGEGFNLLLNEGEEDETTISLVNYINAFDDDFEADFLPVINLCVGETCQYGVDAIKRIK